MTLPNRKEYKPSIRRCYSKSTSSGCIQMKTRHDSCIISMKHDGSAKEMTINQDTSKHLHHEVVAILAPFFENKTNINEVRINSRNINEYTQGIERKKMLGALQRQAEIAYQDWIKAQEKVSLNSPPHCDTCEMEEIYRAEPFLSYKNGLLTEQQGDQSSRCNTMNQAGLPYLSLDRLQQSIISQNTFTKFQRQFLCVWQNFQPIFRMLRDRNIMATYQEAILNVFDWGKQIAEKIGLVNSFSVSSMSPMTVGFSSPMREARKRSNLPKKAKAALRRWFDANLHHPYPTEEDKCELARTGEIGIEQVNNWFINTRGRKWKPMLSRMMAEKEAGHCELYEQMVRRIEQPYRDDNYSDAMQ